MTSARSEAVDLNADLGEGCPNDARLLSRVTSASVSCGAHAGDRETILATLHEARAQGVTLGAHPGFPDRDGFGRREQAVNADEVRRLIVGQFADLARLAEAVGTTLHFVKPHGALYNQAQVQEDVARGTIDALRELGLPLLGQPSSLVERLAGDAGVRFITEGFPDRRYGPDGRLVPRSRPDAILDDPSEFEAQVVDLINAGIQTLCLHGDDPNAVRNVEHLRAVLDRRGIVARFWG